MEHNGTLAVEHIGSARERIVRGVAAEHAPWMAAEEGRLPVVEGEGEGVQPMQVAGARQRRGLSLRTHR